MTDSFKRRLLEYLVFTNNFGMFLRVPDPVCQVWECVECRRLDCKCRLVFSGDGTLQRTVGTLREKEHFVCSQCVVVKGSRTLLKFADQTTQNYVHAAYFE